MAIINGRVPEPDPRFNNMARTVVVKLKEEVARPAPADRVAPYAESAIGEPWTDLRAQFPGLTIRPYFEAEDDVQAFGVNAERVMASGSIEATRYLAVDCPAEPERSGRIRPCKDRVEPTCPVLQRRRAVLAGRSSSIRS